MFEIDVLREIQTIGKGCFLDFYHVLSDREMNDEQVAQQMEEFGYDKRNGNKWSGVSIRSRRVPSGIRLVNAGINPGNIDRIMEECRRM